MSEMCGNYEKHTLPNGDSIFYRDSDHSYFAEVREVKGKWTAVGTSRVPGISTISGAVDACKSVEGLLGWVEREVRAGRDRNEASKMGTYAHRVLESAIRGTRSDISAMPEGAQAFARGIYGFLDEYEVTPLQLECVVYSKEHGFAGRFDARLQVGSEVWLFDLKSMKAVGGKKAKYHAQLAGYEIAAQECGYGPSDRRVILEVDKQGDYSPVEVDAEPQDFLDCLDIYRLAKEKHRVLLGLSTPLGAAA